MNKFLNTLIWLTDYYPHLLIKPRKELFNNFIESFCERKMPDLVRSRLEVEDGDVNDEPCEKLLTVALLVHDMSNVLSQPESSKLNSKKIESLLEDLVLIRSELEYALRMIYKESIKTDELVAHQSDAAIAYLQTLRDEYRQRDFINQHIEDELDFNSELYMQVSNYDKETLRTHLEFLKIIVILCCMIMGPYYGNPVKAMAKELLYYLTWELHDSRILELVMEPNIDYSEDEKGVHTTTKLEIFFAHSNGDKYCARFDFPHDNVSSIHINMHEPCKDTAFPINYERFIKLSPEERTCFFQYGYSFWFRTDYLKLVNTIFKNDSEAINRMCKLFEEQKHFQVGERCTLNQTKDFLKEFFNAISMFDMYYSNYCKTKTIDINDKFERIYLDEKERDVVYCLDLYEQSILLNEKNNKIVKQIIRSTYEDVIREYDKQLADDDIARLNDKDLIELIKCL